MLKKQEIRDKRGNYRLETDEEFQERLFRFELLKTGLASFSSPTILQRSRQYKDAGWQP